MLKSIMEFEKSGLERLKDSKRFVSAKASNPIADALYVKSVEEIITLFKHFTNCLKTLPELRTPASDELTVEMVKAVMGALSLMITDPDKLIYCNEFVKVLLVRPNTDVVNGCGEQLVAELG